MSTLDMSRTRRATKGTGTTLLLVVIFVLASIFMVLLAAHEHVTKQIFYGSLAPCLLGMAAALSMAKGQELVRGLASGQLGPYFGLSTSIVFGLAILTWSSNPPSDQAARTYRDNRFCAKFSRQLSGCLSTLEGGSAAKR